MADNDSIKVPLSKPVMPYGETVTEVTLRRPTTKELRECGQPYRLEGGGLQADYVACAKLLTKVCTPPLPAPTIDELDPGDFDDMAMILVGFTKPVRPSASEAGSARTT